jgi:transketolase
MAENAVGKRLIRLGLEDTYAHGASRQFLMREYGLDAPALIGGIEELLGRSTGVTESDLEAVRIEAVHSLAKAEAL